MMRHREIKKEIKMQTAILKRAEASYNAQKQKDSVLGRSYLKCIESAKQTIAELKSIY